MEDAQASVPVPKSGRDVVVFHVWQSLSYGTRLFLSFALLVAGFAVQAVCILTGLNEFVAFAAGSPLLLLGNLFLLVKGYDNRVDLSRFDPSANWQAVKREKLVELKNLDRAMTSWDKSALDITSWLGTLTLFLLLAAAAVATWFSPGPLRVLILDAAFLAVPHWFTGTRRILRLPKLLVKVEATEGLLISVNEMIKDQDLEVLLLLKGRDTKIPDDVKFRLSFKGQRPDFLGLYGQVVTNDVQGKSYPYFYTVMVAKKGYGLEEIFQNYNPPAEVTKEFDTQDEVEFIVVRQFTTQTSGYHTNPEAAVRIFLEGYGLAQKAALEKAAAG